MKIHWKAMPSPERERQRKIRQGQEGLLERKRKPLKNTQDSMENVETLESMDTKHLIVGTSRRTNLKEKAKARESRNPR